MGNIEFLDWKDSDEELGTEMRKLRKRTAAAKREEQIRQLRWQVKLEEVALAERQSIEYVKEAFPEYYEYLKAYPSLLPTAIPIAFTKE